MDCSDTPILCSRLVSSRLLKHDLSSRCHPEWSEMCRLRRVSHIRRTPSACPLPNYVEEFSPSRCCEELSTIRRRMPDARLESLHETRPHPCSSIGRRLFSCPVH